MSRHRYFHAATEASSAIDLMAAAERVLASSNAGESVGSAELGAVLTLKAPTTTAVGTHTAVLTLTAI